MNKQCGTEVDVLRTMYCTLDTSQSPITPYGLPVVASVVAANVGQYPVIFSPKHPPAAQENVGFEPSQLLQLQLPTAAFKASVFSGVNTACTTSTINNIAANKNNTIKVHERGPPVRVLPCLGYLLCPAATGTQGPTNRRSDEAFLVWGNAFSAFVGHGTPLRGSDLGKTDLNQSVGAFLVGRKNCWVVAGVAESSLGEEGDVFILSLVVRFRLRVLRARDCGFNFVKKLSCRLPVWFVALFWFVRFF